MEITSANRRRRFLRTVLGVALLAFGAIASAADYPTKPIRLVVPYAPGGASDALARAVAQRLQTRLGQSVVVDNRPGAGPRLGTELVVNAPPDGYTILLTVGALAIMPHAVSKPPFDVTTDLAPITAAVTLPLIVEVNATFPATSIPELITHAKANPGKVSYGSNGTGSTTHVAGEMIQQMLGIDVVHIPYKGSGPETVALLAGEIPMAVDGITGFLPHATTDKIRPLAVIGTNRSSLLPNVPTLAELGYPQFNFNSWIGFMAPKGTPAEILALLNREIVAIAKSPEVREPMSKLGMDFLGSTPAEMHKMILSDVATFGSVIRKGNIRIE